ncbi:hypothetical protein DVA86_26255 [Streptomyces armeniacus]|uniref:Uncharacterized protein n=1 Tax=Streptomyces armeniacus TaxID=83291 RepID=A0A345XVF3_9ACTN|nr:hypothetical protein DVA86_26255 [Streptomyces armeniacus]
MGTRLAGAGDKPDWADGGDSSGSMTSDQKAWAAGGEGVRSLRSGIKKVRTRLEPAEGGGSGGEADDFECGAVLQSLNTSWKRYTGDVSGRCGTLAGLLEKAGNDHYKGDQERRAAFEALDAKYEDTAAVGGGKGTGDGDGGR